MNKISKIVSLALAAAICAGSVSIPVLASEVETAAVNSETAVTIAALENFSIENYPFSFVKTLDEDDQIKDHIVYNESSKYKNLLSTRTSNPGYSFGPGYKGDAMILNFYAGYRDKSYGGEEKESSYGNAAQLWFTTKSETLYANPTTGGIVSLPLSKATVGTNKVAFWTKTEKNDNHDRQEAEYVSYSISFRNCGASGVNVRIPNDGQWHYVVADLATPFGEGFDGINVSSSCDGTFGSKNGGKPVLKLNGKQGIYPLDNQDRPITDIPEAYVLIDGEYVKVKTFNVEYEADPEGAYVNIPKDDGTPVYYRSDNTRYILTKDEKGGIVYLADDNGDLLFDIKSGTYITMPDPDVNFADRYTISNVESYRVDDSGAKLLDEEGNPIPAVICGDLVKEIWQQQIYIDEMLFYRTTESGKRTTFLPSGEEDVAYYANTDLDSVLIDGVKVFDVDEDGDHRVLTIPQDIDLSNPDLTRFKVETKCPDVIYAANKDGGTSLPIDISEKGNMKSGSVGSITLPSTIDGKATVTVTSALGTMEEYLFDVKWGFDLSVIDSRGVDTVSGGRKSFTIQNYSDKEKNVQILAAVKDSVTGELKLVAVSTAANGVIPAGESKAISLTVNMPSSLDKTTHSIYYYFYDSVTAMNQVASTLVTRPTK